MTLDGYNKHWIPAFTPLRCSSCNNPIRGSSFNRIGKDPVALKDSKRLCEACYRSYHYGEDSYIKDHKHCILDKSISLEASRRICRCSPDVPHFNTAGNPNDIFPISETDQHIGIKKSGGLQCGLLKLGEYIAEAKYDGMEGKYSQEKQSHKLADMERRASENETKKRQKESKARNVKRNSQTAKPPTSSAVEAKEKDLQEHVPLFLRGYTEKYPFANVHMALRLGPLVIENGVAQ